MAEVVKAGLIADRALFDRLESAPELYGDRALVQDAITAAVRVKIDVVSEDEREGGRRAILNFGHTIGHAVETASNLELLHGEAVSLGMIAALALGEFRGVTAPGLLARTQALLVRLALPVDMAHRISPSVLGLVEADKKRRSNSVRFVFVPRLGEAVLQDIPLDELKRQVPAALAR
jgi:3-dehydroquinate synthase